MAGFCGEIAAGTRSGGLVGQFGRGSKIELASCGLERSDRILKGKPRGLWPPSGMIKGRSLCPRRRCRSGLERSDKIMFERLNQIEAKYDELTKALSSPEVINDSSRYQKTAKAHSEVAEIVEKYREYKDLSRGIEESKAMVAEETD